MRYQIEAFIKLCLIESIKCLNYDISKIFVTYVPTSWAEEGPWPSSRGFFSLCITIYRRKNHNCKKRKSWCKVKRILLRRARGPPHEGGGPAHEQVSRTVSLSSHSYSWHGPCVITNDKHVNKLYWATCCKRISLFALTLHWNLIPQFNILTNSNFCCSLIFSPAGQLCLV